jgi:hypothetical protein
MIKSRRIGGRATPSRSFVEQQWESDFASFQETGDLPRERLRMDLAAMKAEVYMRRRGLRHLVIQRRELRVNSSPIIYDLEMF